MAKYQAYAEYKDSGTEWLGKIPESWEKTYVKYMLKAAPCYGILKPDKYSGENSVPVIRILDIDKNIVDTTQLEAVSPHLSAEYNRTILTEGDLVISVVGTIGKTFICDKNLVGMNLSRALARVQVKNVLYARYLQFLIESNSFHDYINVTCNGAAQKVFNMEALSNWAIPSPNMHEMKCIIEFLEYETAKIDHLIEKQQQLIELLKEKRQAVISHAVTKGLDPNVPMKDSGVEWLGEVPEHWIVKSYRLASRIYRGKFGHRPRNDPAFYDGDYPFIQTGDVARAGKYITSYSQTLNEKGKEVSQLFPKGTLMMAIAANIGDIAILGFEAYAPDSVVGFKPNNDIDLEFLRYSFIAALPALEQTSTQSTQANLNVERIGAVKGTFPSLQEQREIVGYLDNLLEQYRNLVKIAENAISLMQERRTALISAAVTGKIDVRHWQSPIVAEADTELSA
ncbi:restriction endonuclease subunit S [Acinetobacter indicus]|uniref:restriction endonuclease subunit S n=1 Tax=Acinetobacter indicus TaxID=756892 RepID=UPI001C08BC5D|nr:restriction endonuclease subunit S [Acinetobacter indicus]